MSFFDTMGPNSQDPNQPKAKSAPKPTPKALNQVMGLVLKEAATRRDNAAYSGEWNDGGASALEDQVKFYRYGIEGRIPPEWKKYADQATREDDPEWAEYQRLRKKFG